MIDIHCHFLPGIDDGPTTMEESLQMARLACENGISHAILTPHIHPGRYSNNAVSIKNAFNTFQDQLKGHGIPLKIGFAAEVRLSDEILPLIQNSAIPFYGALNGYQILLLELPHSHVPLGSEELVRWLLNKKIRPVIAHPERNKGIMRNLEKLKPFIEMECLFQLTAGAIAGDFGTPAQECARKILELGCVTAIASDAHNIKHRPPRLDHGRDAAAKIVGRKAAEKLVFQAPLELVSSQFPHQF